MAINWLTLQTEYLQTTLSMRALAAKHGVSLSTVEKKAAGEGWASLRAAQASLQKQLPQTESRREKKTHEGMLAEARTTENSAQMPEGNAVQDASAERCGAEQTACLSVNITAQDATAMTGKPAKAAPKQEGKPVKAAPKQAGKPVKVAPKQESKPVKAAPKQADKPVKAAPKQGGEPVKVAPKQESKAVKAAPTTARKTPEAQTREPSPEASCLPGRETDRRARLLAIGDQLTDKLALATGQTDDCAGLQKLVATLKNLREIALDDDGDAQSVGMVAELMKKLDEEAAREEP